MKPRFAIFEERQKIVETFNPYKATIVDETVNVSEDFYPYVTSITIKDKSDSTDKKSDTCTITIADSKENFQIPKPATKYKIYLGYSTAFIDGVMPMHLIGKYVVDTYEVSGRPTVVTLKLSSAPFLKNEQMNVSAMQEQKERTHESQTVKALVDKIASEHKLKSEVDPEVANIVLPTIQQTRESDSNMLYRITKSIGLDFKLANNSILVMKAGNKTTGESTTNFKIDVKEMNSWTFNRSKRPNYASVKAYWYDAEAGSDIEEYVGDVTYSIGNEKIIGKPLYIIKTPFPNYDTAITSAKAVLEKARKDGISFNAKMTGRPDIYAGAKIELFNLPYEILGNNWKITEIEHQISASSGYNTNITCEPI